MGGQTGTDRDAGIGGRAAASSPGLRASLVWISIIALLLIFGCSSGHAQLSVHDSARAAAPDPNPNTKVSARIRATSHFARPPLSFEENRGQADARVKFLSRGPGYTLFLTNEEAVFAFPSRRGGIDGNTQHPGALRLRFEHSDPCAQMIGQGELPGKTNYFPSGDRSTWHTDLRNYSGVAYREIYAGVDAVFHGNPQRLEVDFEVAPGANASKIAFDIGGGRALHPDGHGNMVVGLGPSGRDGQVILGKPVVYQQIAGVRREVAGKFVLRSKHRIGFELGSYDRAQPLVIDPTLSYSTYLGGSAASGNVPTSYGQAVAVDSSGNAYVTGGTISSNFPTPTGTGGASAPQAFVTKFGPDGTLLYTSFTPEYFGVWAIAVDSSGSAYLGGSALYGVTTTPGAYSGPSDGGNLLTVIELSPDGSAIAYAAQIGSAFASNENLWGIGIAVDSSGSAYVATSTNLGSYPTTPGTYQSSCWSTGCTTEAAVTKLSPDGSSLVYSTLLGGHGGDYATGIAVDANGDAFVTGVTGSTDFPTTAGALQPSCSSSSGYANQPPDCADEDLFVSELNPGGTALVYSTYLGNGIDLSNGEDSQVGIALDAAGNAYVSGTTDSTVFTNGISSGAGPTIMGPAMNCNSGYMICRTPGTPVYYPQFNFLAKVAPGGGTLAYLGFLGAYNASPLGGVNGSTIGDSVAVDSSGNAYLTGLTSSNYFPTTPDAQQGSFQEDYPYVSDDFCSPSSGCASEAYFSILNTGVSGSSSLVYSTYLGAAALDENPSAGLGVAVDSSGNAWLTGETTSSTFPTTPNALQSSCESASSSPPYCDDYAFVAEFATATAKPATAIAVVSGGGQSATIGQAFANPLVVKVTDSSNDPVSGATVTFNVPVSGASASLSSTTGTTASDGTASVTATANGIASSTAYSVSATVAGVSTPATFSLTNTPATTAVTVTPSALSLVYGQPVTINAAISPVNVDGSTPTGSVTFYDGTTVLTPNSTVSGAAASYIVNVPTVGSHTYGAQYLGDTNFRESALTNAASAVVVGKAAVNLAGPATQPVDVEGGTAGSIQVTISAQYSGNAIDEPSGGLSYSVSGNAFGPGSLLVANGTATIPVPGTVAAGTYTVTVSYAGDVNYNSASISIQLVVSASTGGIAIIDPETVTVNDSETQVTLVDVSDPETIHVIDTYSVKVGPLPTSILLSGPSSATVNQAITFTATVEHSGTALVPTGSVTFTVNGNMPVSVALNASGMATWTTNALPAGSYTIAATYAGTPSFNGSSGSASIKVAPSSTTVGLSASATSVMVNSPVTFAAAVSGPGGPIGFSGKVTFDFKGAAISGCSAVAVNSAAGIAGCTTSALPAGNDSITAIYSGDPNFLSSTSPPVTVTVIDFELNLSAPPNLDLFPGQSVSFPFIVSPANGVFSGTIGFTMSGLPPDVTATFDPSSVTLGDTSQTVTVTLTAATLAALKRTGPGSKAAPFLVALVLPLLGLGRVRRRLGRGSRLALLVLLSLATITGLTACGGGFFNQPPKTYTVTLTATSGTAQHSATFNLTVE